MIDHLDLSTNQRERFETCGSDAWIQREQGSGDLRVTSKTCKLRFCPACRLRRGRSTKAAITRAMATAPLADWRFITLTARHSARPLSDQLADLRSAFRRLRQRAAWKAYVDGGVAVLEITWNRRSSRWHPHLHLIASGSFFPQQQLSRLWLSVTRSSCIVDIRAVWQIESAVDYVCKYLAKSPIAAFSDDPDPLIEYVTATARGHMLIPFGSAKPPKQEPNSVDRGELWQPVCSLAVALQRAASGEPFYVRMVGRLSSPSAGDVPPDSPSHHDPPHLGGS